jgi:MFS family permease
MTFVIETFQNYIAQVRRLAAHRSYKRLLAGSIVSGLGDRIGFIAFLAAVSSHSNDVLAVGGITISEMLPGVVALPFVSMVVDRFDKRRLLLIADIARAILYILAAFAGDLWVFYALGFTSTCFTLLFEPSRQALEPHYIPDGELTQANGMRMGLLSLVMLVGPAVGGLLSASVGFQSAFLVNAASFLFSAWMVTDLEEVKFTPAEKEETLMKEIAGGLRIVWRTPELKFLFVQMAAFAFVIGIQFPLIFVWVRENLGGGPAEAGWLFSAIGIGGIIGGAILASLEKEKKPFDAKTAAGRRNIALLSIADGIVVLFFAPITHFAPAVGVFAAFGLIGTSFHVGISTAITELSPVAFRGRIFSLYSALQGPLIVLSIALGAPLAREYGAKDVFFVSGGLEIIVGIIAIAFAGKIISRPEIEEAVA